MIGDGECTWWPDVWFGLSLTPCCVEHDQSDLDLHAALNLGICVYRTLEHLEYGSAGIVLGAVMCAGTAAWSIVRRLKL